MASLPTGTVTFLFTDIEGSTQLAGAYPGAWEPARERHHAILRAAAEQHNGYVFQIVGDAFCMAFHNAFDAADAAHAAQRALVAAFGGDEPALPQSIEGTHPPESSPAPLRLRVRMGLHTGRAEPRAEDTSGNAPEGALFGRRATDRALDDARSGAGYLGYLALAQVQRVVSLAYGGQILVSNATAGLLAGQLPAPLALRDLGEHRLKGLLSPERLWQLIAPDLPSDFPPLPAPAGSPNNLPIQTTSFVGRERELSELKLLLPTARLLSLTGAGGTGKTRLALQIASEVLDSYPDGVWLVELASLTVPALVPHTVAVVLGLREEQGCSIADTLLDWLRPKQLLLILDNCEHLLDACAQLADSILHAGRQTRILATSREALGIGGELAYRVPSLPAPDLHAVAAGRPPRAAAIQSYAAVRLFVERAAFAQPGFSLTDANAPAVAQICYRLDGIPLAIELAAARVKAMRVEQIAERLDDRFRLLAGGSRTALPRQQTLRSMIDWSHSLLSEPERVLLRRLAVFAGGWTLAAAEAVCADAENPGYRQAELPPTSNFQLPPSDILDLLTHLIDKSLVVLDEQGSEPRYRMLETIRQYAREKLLDSEEGAVLRDRHQDFFLRLAAQAEPLLLGAQQAQVMARLENEYDNLRAALEWASERDPASAWLLAGLLRWFWAIGDHLNEGQAWYRRVLALPSHPDSARERALALLGAGQILAFLYTFEEAFDVLAECVAAWRALADPAKLAEAVCMLGFAMLQEGRASEASALFAGHEMLSRQASPTVLAFTLSYWGSALEHTPAGEPAAQARHAEALSVARESRDPQALGMANMNMGFWWARRRDYAQAKRYHLAALDWRRKGITRWTVGLSLRNVADVSCLLEEYAQARTLYAEALALFRAIGHQSNAASVLVGQGYLALRAADLSEAAALLAESLEICRARADHRELPRCLTGHAELRRMQGLIIPAMQLLSYVELVCQTGHRDLGLIARFQYDRTLAAARATLDEAAFDAAWAEGRALTLDQAIALALEDSRG